LSAAWSIHVAWPAYRDAASSRRATSDIQSEASLLNSYESGMMVDADGAYHAYNPDGKSGLD